MMKPRFLTLVGMVGLAAFARLLPHPWNFTPLAAISLFAGAHFQDKRQAYLIPLVAVFASDFFLGFYPLWPVVYIAHASVVSIGLLLQKTRRVSVLALGVGSGSVCFFVISNLSTFFSTGLYAQTWGGLLQCYIAALPFFRTALMGDLFYSAILFGAFKLAQARFPVLANPSAQFAR